VSRENTTRCRGGIAEEPTGVEKPTAAWMELAHSTPDDRRKSPSGLRSKKMGVTSAALSLI
jgi:hypothetical protein